MAWSPEPLIVAAALAGGITASVMSGEWLENRFNIDAFAGSIGVAMLIFGALFGFVVPA